MHPDTRALAPLLLVLPIAAACDGAISPSTADTDAGGRARTAWTLGGSAAFFTLTGDTEGSQLLELAGSGGGPAPSGPGLSVARIR